jgi:hypothetical protein
VRDGISLATAGHPVMVFVHDHFELAARAHARGLGVPDLKLYVFPPVKPGPSSSALEAEQAARAARELPELLLQRGG